MKLKLKAVKMLDKGRLFLRSDVLPEKLKL
ncbi:hypothetical protein PM3016_652 [Paenibacillus mucilaginosus 3016]|uniref:Uncharacterized protein n=1 Tax=Paenibacillus mucilaginosus 3016 TaxID=1116391 RepID=H6NTF4_9BACL|nr:hypothetical protein PM3016_652 [Paenibacillus mucilaginosus 3016]